MTPRTILLTGLGLLLLSLLLVLDMEDVGPVRAWLMSVLPMIGSGLVVVSALVSALTRTEAAPVHEPEIDHYS